VLFFSPLFIYKKGKGVSAYYDFSDLKQDPNNLVIYYNQNKDDFFRLEGEYMKIIDKIMALVEKKDVNDYDELYGLVYDFFPYLAQFIALAGEFEPKVGDDIATKALQLRQATDQILYKAGDALSAMAKEKVDEKYHDNIGFLSYKEISSGDLPDIEEVKKRAEGYIYFKGDLLVMPDIDGFLKEHDITLVEDKVDENIREINGFAASGGKITGIVKVVLEFNQFDSVKEGDVLVAPMTTPDYMPIMKKASAFITDEGGITCHAAIVARELGKPCIIGTKIATKVLKDGDLVEVDADKGVVKLLINSN